MVYRNTQVFPVYFLDPCDGITNLLYPPSGKVFLEHNFSNTTPNAKTRQEVAMSGRTIYYTLSKYGLWQRRDRNGNENNHLSVSSDIN